MPLTTVQHLCSTPKSRPARLVLLSGMWFLQVVNEKQVAGGEGKRDHKPLKLCLSFGLFKDHDDKGTNFL